jgi:hypothetical protein
MIIGILISLLLVLPIAILLWFGVAFIILAFTNDILGIDVEKSLRKYFNLEE